MNRLINKILPGNGASGGYSAVAHHMRPRTARGAWGRDVLIVFPVLPG